MSSTPVEVDKKTIEAQNLYKHKFDNFVRILGPDWPLDDIHALVESDVYHGDLENFLKAGCSKKTAVRILL